MIDDVYKRPFITAGFTALVLMVPLALTSTSGMIRRLGGQALAIAAPADLRQRDRRSDSLLLAGEIRRTRAAAVCVVVGVLLGYRVRLFYVFAAEEKQAAREEKLARIGADAA